MSALESVPAEHDIVARCQSGALVLDLDNWDTDEDNPDSLLNRCIALHNSGQLDLLSLIDTQQFSALDGHSFFILQHFFNEAIPQLTAPIDQLMRAVDVLVEKGGNDMMANAPNGAFRAWCAKDINRSSLVIDMADRGDPLAIRFLTFALESTGDVALARAMVSKYADSRRVFGITALGRIKSGTLQMAKETAELLLPFVSTEYDDHTRCNALSAICGICEPFPEVCAGHIPQAVVAATASFNEQALLALTRALWVHPKIFDRGSLKMMLDAMTALDGTKAGVANDLDRALGALFGTPNKDLVLDFLAAALSGDNSTHDLERMKEVRHKIANSDRDELFRLIVCWLLSGDRQLCESVSQVLKPDERNRPFDTNIRGLGLAGPDLLFLAYKAIGYLFVNPVVAASIVVSSIREADKVTATKLGDLLFDPLLINYGGEVRDYMRTIKRGDASFNLVRKALKRVEAYFDGLDLGFPIKELRPSEYQRNVERMRAQDMMRQVQKSAEEQSVFFNLVHRSVLLYGRKSLTFVEGPSGSERQPVAMDLHSFSTSFELPRMEVIDPVGLNYTIRLFRAMRRK